MLKLTRLPDWDRRLARVTERHINTPLVWGESDCLLAAADAVEAVTGIDPATKVRGKYSTEIGAAKLMRRRKADDVEDVLQRLFPHVGRLLAQRGDLAVVRRGRALCAGFVTEYGVAVKTDRGLEFVAQDNPAIEAAFKVG